MLSDALPEVIPLTTGEKARLRELEAVVEKHMEGFLAVGRALSEIRSRRLYRVQYPSFEAYLKARWGVALWRASEVIASYKCAELLLATTGAPDGPTPLPEHIPPGPMREIARIEGEDLKAQSWRLVSTVSQKSGTSLSTAARQISYMVRSAIREAESSSNGEHPEASKASKPALAAPKAVFVRAIIQLSRTAGFDPELAVLHVRNAQEAATIYRACQLIAKRCCSVQALLQTRYPQVQCHPEHLNGSNAFGKVAVGD